MHATGERNKMKQQQSQQQLLLQQKQRIKELLKEASKRKKVNFFLDTFKEQADFIRDPSRMKALICTRRAAKSYTMLLHLFKDCYENPGVSCLFIALSRHSAKRIAWKDVVMPIIRKHNLDCEPKESELSVHFGNGSILYFVGADSGPEEMNKLLGQKFYCCVVDEASMWRQDTKDLIYTILKPAVADYRGTIIFGGTPSNITRGLFYDLTFDSKACNRQGWSIHSWDTYSNPYMAKQWDAEIKELMQAIPGIEQTPRFLQMYKKQWVIDLEAKVYKLTYQQVIKNEDLKQPLDNYIMGIDLGYDDETAFVIGGWNNNSKNVYVVDSWSKSKMLIDAVGDKIKEFMAKYDITTIVIDNASKQLTESLRDRYNLIMEPADKRGKEEHILLMNTDLMINRLQITDNNEKLIDEMMNLIWDVKADGSRKELASLGNHLCFPAGTKIMTPNGEVNIEELQLGDTVCSQFGNNKITACMNSVSHDIVTLTLNNGQTITSTADHPFRIGDQWIPASKLLGLQITPWSLRDLDIGGMVDTSNVTTQKNTYCIEQCGLPSMDQYQKDIISTISQETDVTTQLTTLNAFPQNNTGRNMSSQEEKLQAGQRMLKGLEPINILLNNGTKVRKAESGIDNIVEPPSSLIKCANYVTSNTKVEAKDWASAQTAVVKSGTSEIQSGHGSVSIVNKSIQQSTLPVNQDFVVSSVRRITNQPTVVYNITVENEHNYYANQILVSNCDATLYMYMKCYAYLSIIPEKKQQKSQEQLVNEQLEQEAEEMDLIRTSSYFDSLYNNYDMEG